MKAPPASARCRLTGGLRLQPKRTRPLQPALQLPTPRLVRSWAKRFTLPTLRLSAAGLRAGPLRSARFIRERGRVLLLWLLWRLHGAMLRRRVTQEAGAIASLCSQLGEAAASRQVTVEQQPGLSLGSETRSGADGKGCGRVGGPAFSLSVRCTARVAEPVVLGG
ncbi:hypothetical protein HJG60_009660 [Phyllostomus discolor]|uniref:Uncharacterized protein n=1 Tax=Phyllostomus discolor TaxID=89673 RepID=A0A834B2A4_9CHIR|nr:hypothetical protein HJG60_009660 [Phyllostomus discolor]